MGYGFPGRVLIFCLAAMSDHSPFVCRKVSVFFCPLSARPVIRTCRSRSAPGPEITGHKPPRTEGNFFNNNIFLPRGQASDSYIQGSTGSRRSIFRQPVPSMVEPERKRQKGSRKGNGGTQEGTGNLLPHGRWFMRLSCISVTPACQPWGYAI